MLEVQLQTELYLTRIARPARICPQNRCQRVRELPKSSRADIPVRVSEVGMVKCIEEFGSELQFEPLREMEIFENAQVPHLKSRTVKLIGSTRPESSGCGRRKRRRIE